MSLRIPLILTTLIIFSSLSIAHTQPCATDELHQKTMQTHPELQAKWQQSEEAYIAAMNTPSPKSASTYVIPVVVHIIHNNGSENISDARVIQGIEHMNQAFENIAPYDPTTGVDMDIEFCLAERDPDGNATTGINRVVSPLTQFDYNQDDITVKDLSRWDPLEYINIWLVGNICSGNGCGVAGYAYFPSAHGLPIDGIVAEAGFVGNTPGGSAVLAHEMGHYLGLYHTFQNSCTNYDCLSDGDRVCDTPPDGSTAGVPCDFVVNSCSTDTNSGFTTDQNDMFWNYMDYGDWDCYSAFTEGQRDRAQFFLTGTRASLLASQGCLDPCPNPISTNFTVNNTTVNVGETVNFNNNTTNATTYDWLVDGVSFSNATNSNYTFNSLGTYTITLLATNGDENCADSFELTINVVCPVSADFTPSNYYPIPGESVTFSNSSQNATSYNWTIDGVNFSTNTNITTSFAEGVHTICLIADINGLCEDSECVTVWAFPDEDNEPLPCDDTYIKDFGSDEADKGTLLIDIPGGFLIGGGKGDSTLLIRLDINGNIVWNRTFDFTPYPEVPSDALIDSDGNLVLVGWGRSTGSLRVNYILKYNYLTNNVIWVRTLSSPTNTAFKQVMERGANQNYFVAGVTGTNSAPGNGCDALFLEIDRNTGAKVNENNFMLGSCEEFSKSLVYNNSIYITGRYNYTASFSGMRPAITNLDFSGNELWSKTYLVSPNNTARLYSGGLVVENDAIFILGSGDINGTSASNIALYLTKTDINGNIQWAKEYNLASGDTEWLSQIVSIPDGFILKGNYNEGAGKANFLIKVDKQGVVQWSKSFTNLNGVPYSMDLITKNGAIYFTSYTDENDSDIVFTKLTPDGELGIPCQFLADLPVNETDIQNPSEDTVDLIEFIHPLTLSTANHTATTTNLVVEEILCSTPCTEICDNTLDDDGDGLVDCEDPDCECIEICDNGIDDDQDGLPDCQDPDCACTDFCLPTVPPLELGADITVCENGVHTFDAGAGHDQYIWQDGSTEQTYTAYEAGVYSVTVIDSCDIIQMDSVRLFIEPVSEINFEDVTLCEGDSITLTVSTFFDNFTWLPDEGLSCDDCQSVTIKPTQTTVYQVIGTSQLGCITVDTFKVEIEPCLFVEICDNGIDDDGDGLIDCYDPDCCPDAVCVDFYYDDCPVDCEFTPDNTPFQMEEEWRYSAGNWHSYNTAITGDVDGDGMPEVIGKKGPWVLGVENYNDILIINGQNGSLETTINTPSLKWALDAVAIADINRNGYAEIILIASNNNSNAGHLYCYEFDGTQYQELWVSDTGVSTNFDRMAWSPEVADFNEDGNAEIYVSHQIFDGLTGQLLVNGGNNNRGVLFNNDISTQTIAVDVLPDNFCTNCSGLELVAGNQVYSIDDANTVMNVEVQAAGADDGFVGIADMDRDGDLDAIITYGSTFTTASVYIWDIQTPNQIGTTHSFTSFSSSVGALISQPNIADIDNDGNLDIGISGKFIYKFLTLNNGNLNEMWSFSTSDESGRTGSTIFDFEGDGDKEIAYRDESQLRIFDATGATIFSSSCTSGTAFEYPVIVDVDADGETELLCSCDNQLVAYGSANTPWLPTRSVWNQHAYFNVNINDDLTVPPVQQQQHIVGDSMVLNNFLTQYSDIEFPVADATISIENADCAMDEFDVTITICNIGDNTLSFETPITFYDNNPTQTSANALITLTLGQNIEQDSCFTQNYTIPSLYNQEIYVIVNDDASLNPVFSLENDFPVTAIAECDFTNNIDNFIVPLNAPILDLGIDTTACDAINLELNAGGDFATYEWQDGSTDSTFTITDAGVYSVTVTDICGNIQTDDLTVILEDCCDLSLSIILTDVTCAAESGTINTFVEGGQMPYTYNWSTGSTDPYIIDLEEGTYYLTLTDQAGCIVIDTSLIRTVSHPMLFPPYPVEDTLCRGDTTGFILPSGSLGYHEWSPTTGLNTGYPPLAMPDTTTTYIFTGYRPTGSLVFNQYFEDNTGFDSDYTFDTDPSSDLPEGSYAITSNANLVNSTFEDCEASFPPNMMIVNGASTPDQNVWCQDVLVVPDTDYIFPVRAASISTSNPAMLQLYTNGLPIGTPHTLSDEVCAWENFFSHWNSGTNTFVEICIANENTSTEGNDFALDIIGFSPVCIERDTITIYVSDITAEIIDIQDSDCNTSCAGTITVIGSGGFVQNDYNYLWSDGQTTATATDLCAGIYTVTMTDDEGCEAVASAEITQETGLTLQTTVLAEVTCGAACMGSASVAVTGGTMPFTYTWSSGANTDTASDLCAGTYTVTVTDTNDCQNTAQVEIGSSSTLMFSGIGSTPVSCLGGNDGTATASATGGVPPYTYAWNTGEMTETISNLTAGVYTVQITDANGCTLPPVNITVVEPLTSVSVDIEATDPTCNGLNDGYATALPEGGTPSYDYQWSDGSSTQTAFNLTAGDYSLTVTDANGCTATATTLLTDPSEIIADISTEDVICFGDETGTILVENASGGMSPYTYSLDGENYVVSDFFAGLAAGTHSVYVQDAEGCVAVFDAFIVEPPELLVDLGADITIDLSDSTQLFVQTNSTDSLSYLWNPPDGLSCIDCPDPIVNISDTETYTLIVTDSDGCMATDDITITIDKNRNVFIPNVFSPNNDGTNDVFMIYGGKGVVGVLELKIYDRWGELIFENSNFATDDPTMGWDGTFRGQIMNPAVFVYHTEVEFFDGVKVVYSGDITLVK